MPTITVSAPRSRAAWAVEQGAGAEGVHDVEGGDVDDHPAGPVGADLLHQVLLELDDLAVVQRLVDGGDEVAALPQDRNQHLDRPVSADGCRPGRTG